MRAPSLHSLAASVLATALAIAHPATALAQSVEDDDLDVPAAPAEAPPASAPAPVEPPAPSPPPAPAPSSAPSPAPSTAPAPSSSPSPAPPPTASTAPAPASAEARVAAVAAAAPTDDAERPFWLSRRFNEAGLELAGFVQAQGQLDQQSEDQRMQGGAPLNHDGFVVRRARVAIARRWSYAALAIELDASTIRGAAVELRRAEASWIGPVAAGAGPGAPPVAAVAIGVTDIPFGFELLQQSRDRLFMERSLASLAFFPEEPDVGARAWGGFGPFRYAVALLAGEPIRTSDPNRAKDLIARAGVEARPSRRVTIAGGVSLLVGQGFHAGRDATKDSLEWRDLNENGAVELGELSSIPGTAATPSENFRRWALGGDLAVALRSRLGWTFVSAEVTVASNLDRGLFVADPVTAGVDLRHLGGYVAVTQDLGRRLFLGARVDFYDPNLDALDARGGELIPISETITTISPLLGARFPHHMRASIQYDWVIDSLARDGRGVPADLANNRLIARLQVDL